MNALRSSLATMTGGGNCFALIAKVIAKSSAAFRRAYRNKLSSYHFLIAIGPHPGDDARLAFRRLSVAPGIIFPLSLREWPAAQTVRR